MLVHMVKSFCYAGTKPKFNAVIPDFVSSKTSSSSGIVRSGRRSCSPYLSKNEQMTAKFGWFLTDKVAIVLLVYNLHKAFSYLNVKIARKNIRHVLCKYSKPFFNCKMSIEPSRNYLVTLKIIKGIYK